MHMFSQGVLPEIRAWKHLFFFFLIPIVEAAPEGRMEEKSGRTFWRNGAQQVPSNEVSPSGVWLLGTPSSSVLPVTCHPSSRSTGGVDHREDPERAGWPLPYGFALLPYLLFSPPDSS